MYYPKSQIKTNLYTNGNELRFVSNKEVYSGYYWTTSDGKYYSGKTPQDTPTQELTIIQKGNVFVPQSNVSEIDTTSPNISLVYYNQLNPIISPSLFLPTYYQPQPTQQDYQIGEFRRYFVKKVNEIFYIEVSKDTFENIVNRNPQWLYQYYTAFNIPWAISGDKLTVAKTNKDIVGLTIQRFNLPKFNLYLRDDYTKFYK